MNSTAWVMVLRVAAAAWVGGTLAMVVLTLIVDVDVDGADLAVGVLAVTVLWVVVAAALGRYLTMASSEAPAARTVPAYVPAPAHPPAQTHVPAPTQAPAQTQAPAPVHPPARTRAPAPVPALSGAGSGSATPATTWHLDAARDGAARRAAPAPAAPAPPSTRVVVDDRPPTSTELVLRPAGRRRGSAGSDQPAQIVQCTRCGSFSIDARGEEGDHTFDCRSCGLTWSWSVGSAWPTTIVRPR